MDRQNYILDSFSATTEQNRTKFDKQEFIVLYQVCVFRADQRDKMATLISDWLRHTELNEHWLETIVNMLYQVCVFRPIRKPR